ncbi:hypothetical protein BJ508DRAFT_324554 [Ascobolus immersus RN42]|uniref:Uncharacterized protein n=1 Tax=Ascobolus immersus RN42 TaxID=1160509 RepID=A0A3N4IFS0_ASCIM|nr:hypothetical protein BJ508DRAFT_324554 [Ascobolus immersus RN42]
MPPNPPLSPPTTTSTSQRPIASTPSSKHRSLHPTTLLPSPPTSPTSQPLTSSTSTPTRPPLHTRSSLPAPFSNLDTALSSLSLRQTISNPTDLTASLEELNLRPDNSDGREEDYPGLGSALNPAFGESLEGLRLRTVNRGGSQDFLELRRKMSRMGIGRRLS